MDMFKTGEGLRQRPAYADIASIPRRLSPRPVGVSNITGTSFEDGKAHGKD